MRRPCVLEEGVAVARFAVGEQRDVAAGHVIAVELVPLAAADVLGEDERRAGDGLEGGAEHAIGEEGELLACASRDLDEMNLAGVGEASGDEHLAFDGVPAEERGGARVAIACGLFGDRGGDGRDVFKHKVVGGLDGRWRDRLGDGG